MKKAQTILVSAAVAALLSLAACGGGYGGGGGGSGGYGGGMSSSSSSSSSGSGSSSGSTAASAYVAMDVVRDTADAARTDANLVNGWGVAFNPSGYVWVAANGTGKSTLYDGDGVPQSLVVTIPSLGGSPSMPTGIVFNGGTAFILNSSVGAGGPGGYGGAMSGVSAFIFDTMDGTIAAWSPDVDLNQAYTVYDGHASGAVYTGLAILTGATNRLYATDFHNARIDVFGGTFTKISVPGGFTDPSLPAGYAPFNIQAVGGQLYVAYAKVEAGTDEEEHGAGLGYVSVFDSDGVFVKRLISNGALNAPWGFALAPANFGAFSNDLLVGNFGDGRINAYDPATGAMVGTLSTSAGAPIVIDGLWGIAFGNDLHDQPANTLFYAAGPQDETHGAYGRIDLQ